MLSRTINVHIMQYIRGEREREKSEERERDKRERKEREKERERIIYIKRYPANQHQTHKKTTNKQQQKARRQR